MKANFRHLFLTYILNIPEFLGNLKDNFKLIVVNFLVKNSLNKARVYKALLSI